MRRIRDDFPDAHLHRAQIKLILIFYCCENFTYIYIFSFIYTLVYTTVKLYLLGLKMPFIGGSAECGAMYQWELLLLDGCLQWNQYVVHAAKERSAYNRISPKSFRLVQSNIYYCENISESYTYTNEEEI